MFKEEDVKIKKDKSELLYDGLYKIKKAEKEIAGRKYSGEVLKKGDTVAGIVYDTKTKKYIFIEEYKLAANGVTIEVLQGSIEGSEKAEQTMKRLVTERTGYKVDSVSFLTSYYVDTVGSDEICFLYYVEVSSTVIDDLEFNGYKVLEVEKLGLGGKLFIKDPINLMSLDTDKDKENDVIPPFQCVDVKTLTAIMWVENNNVLKEVAQTITNSKIRSL